MGVAFGMLAKGQSRVGSGKGRGVDFVKGFKRVEQAGFSPREERHKKWPSNVCVEGRGGVCVCNSGD